MSAKTTIPVTVGGQAASDDFTIDFTACNRNGHSADPKHATLEDHQWRFVQEGSAN